MEIGIRPRGKGNGRRGGARCMLPRARSHIRYICTSYMYTRASPRGRQPAAARGAAVRVELELRLLRGARCVARAHAALARADEGGARLRETIERYGGALAPASPLPCPFAGLVAAPSFRRKNGPPLRPPTHAQVQL